MDTRDTTRQKNQIRDLIIQSETLWKKGQLERAESLAQEALQLIKQDPFNIFGHGDALHILGLIHYKKEEFSTAEDFLKQALDLWEKSGTQKDVLITSFDLGYVYAKEGKNLLAKECFQRALALAERLKDSEMMAGILINLGVTHWRLGELSEAEMHYQRSIAIYKELDDKTMIKVVQNNLAAVNQARGKLDSI
ncbi:MAG: tetratricopeptide repeat protein [Candidatus Hodarchaeota archaeon]